MADHPSLREYQVNKAANWASLNPVDRAGTIYVEEDTGKVKVADGSTAYASLNYSAEPLTADAPTFLATVSVALDFPSIAANTGAVLTATVTGVAAGDEITVTPTGATNTGLNFRAEYVSANTVNVVAQNVTVGAIDSASVTFRIVARRYA